MTRKKASKKLSSNILSSPLANYLVSNNPNASYDGVEIPQEGFEIEGEVIGGELAAVVVVELLNSGNGEFKIQVKSGICETQERASNSFIKQMLQTALDEMNRQDPEVIE